MLLVPSFSLENNPQRKELVTYWSISRLVRFFPFLFKTIHNLFNLVIDEGRTE